MVPQTIPQVTFRIRVPMEMPTGTCSAIDAEWGTVSTDELFNGKKVVVFALPGAFTPTCSSTHLPGYEAKFEEFKALGVDSILCVSVNDPFVMYEWGRMQGVKNVRLIPDGNCDFTEKMGMLVEKRDRNFGMRSWRYSMFVDNGEIKKVFEEAGKDNNVIDDPFAVSDVGTMLNYLKSM